MAYIYQIINKINNKIYIGKTEFSIEKRFKEHCRDAIKENQQNRPLYAAMKKYGIENFYIELIEETNFPEERERYWIEQKQTFKNGYNATIGGDGKAYLDYDLIYILFQQGLSLKEIQEKTKYNASSIQRILRNKGVSAEEARERSFKRFNQYIAKLDPITEEIIEIYTSLGQAEKANGNTQHIGDVCRGKRKTCKGYKWKYL